LLYRTAMSALFLSITIKTAKEDAIRH